MPVPDTDKDVKEDSYNPSVTVLAITLSIIAIILLISGMVYFQYVYRREKKDERLLDVSIKFKNGSAESQKNVNLPRDLTLENPTYMSGRGNSNDATAAITEETA